jgi:hypothetical protein
MQKVEVEQIVRYIIEHPSTLLWYRWYLKKRHNLPFFTLSYSADLKQKGVPVDMTRDKEVVVLVPVYTPYGVGGANILTTTPEAIMWSDGDFAFWGNWKFYGRFAWMASLNRKHPLRRYVLGEMKREEKLHGTGKA